MPGHLFWLQQCQQKQKCGREIGQDTVLAAKLCGIFGNINEMHKVGCVRGVRRSIGIAHLLAISVIGSDDTFAIKFGIGALLVN